LITRASTSPVEAHQQPVAQARRAGGLFVAVGRQARKRRGLVGLGRAHEKVAVGVALDHVGDTDGREASRGAGPALARRALLPV
jgi:hypothetical protein